MVQGWLPVGKEVAGRWRLLGMAVLGCTGKLVSLVLRSRLALPATRCLREKGTGSALRYVGIGCKAPAAVSQACNGDSR